MPEASSTANPARSSSRVLELRVRNHPGAMSHITGLFARRAFNLESIVCVPNTADQGATSTILLGVPDEPRLDQMQQQLAKLHDVLAVRCRSDLGASVFQEMMTLAMREAP